jgi:hypothetical protein
MGDDLLAWLPRVHPGTGAQHHARHVRTDHVVRQVVPRGELGQLPVAAQEGERGHRREDGTPHGVVVDRARHHRDQGLAEAEFGDRHLLDVQRLTGIPVARVEAVEHVLFVPVQGNGPVGLRQRHRGEIGGLAARVEDHVKYLFHGRLLIHGPSPPHPRSAGRERLPPMDTWRGDQGPFSPEPRQQACTSARNMHYGRQMRKIALFPERPIVRTFLGRPVAPSRRARPGEMTTRVPGSGDLRPCPDRPAPERVDRMNVSPQKRV